MKIGVIGHNYTHGADFVMDYPKGPGCYLFLLVKSPARFLLNGKKLRLEKNTILFFTPHTACRYAAENGTYTDDWFYCNMTPEEELALRNEGMPFDTPDFFRHLHVVPDALDQFSNDLAVFQFRFHLTFPPKCDMIVVVNFFPCPRYRLPPVRGFSLRHSVPCARTAERCRKNAALLSKITGVSMKDGDAFGLSLGN